MGYKEASESELIDNSSAKSSRVNDELSAENCGIKHLAITPDGHRRWSQLRGQDFRAGFEKGFCNLMTIPIELCLQLKIPHLSLAWTTVQNHQQRSKEEEAFALHLAQTVVQQNLNNFVERSIHVRFVGEHALYERTMKAFADHADLVTKPGNLLQVNILFYYSPEYELLDVVKRIAHEVAAGNISPDEISHEIVRHHLWMGDSPDPDLFIRFGGKKRLSGTLGHQGSYTELMFSDLFWPDVTREHLLELIQSFQQLKRNFGK